MTNVTGWDMHFTITCTDTRHTCYKHVTNIHMGDIHINTCTRCDSLKLPRGEFDTCADPAAPHFNIFKVSQYISHKVHAHIWTCLNKEMLDTSIEESRSEVYVSCSQHCRSHCQW